MKAASQHMCWIRRANMRSSADPDHRHNPDERVRSSAMSVTRWGGLRLADRGLMSASVLRRRQDLAVLGDRCRRTDDKTTRDIGPGGNQLGNQPGKHAADLRECAHPVSDLLPPRKRYGPDAKSL
jgi:hypothetical protein